MLTCSERDSEKKYFKTDSEKKDFKFLIHFLMIVFKNKLEITHLVLYLKTELNEVAAP